MTQDEIVAKIIDFHSRPRRKARECIGHYVVGANARHEAICLVWRCGTFGHVDRAVLRAIFAEARGAKFKGPIHVHAATTTMGETESFRFYQERD
jgi:hypothetical protein